MKQLKSFLLMVFLAFFAQSVWAGYGSFPMIQPIMIQPIMIQPIRISPIIITPFQINGAGIRITSIGISSLNPMVINPTVINPSIFSFPRYGMGGLSFNDIYIVNPDYHYEAKDYASLSKQDLKRFGINGAEKSSLEAELFPESKLKTAIAKTLFTFPAFLYSVDERLDARS